MHNRSNIRLTFNSERFCQDLQIKTSVTLIPILTSKKIVYPFPNVAHYVRLKRRASKFIKNCSFDFSRSKFFANRFCGICSCSLGTELRLCLHLAGKLFTSSFRRSMSIICSNCVKEWPRKLSDVTIHVQDRQGADLQTVTVAAPKSLFSCVNRSPV